MDKRRSERPVFHLGGFLWMLLWLLFLAGGIFFAGLFCGGGDAASLAREISAQLAAAL